MMNFRARKRFGQHFLHDPGVIKKIVSTINPGEGIPVIEIGPGRGALTGPLLQELETLTVIEIDTELAELLATDFSHPGLDIHRADVLTVDFSDLSDDKIKVVGNLPYNISTPLLFHLLDYLPAIHSMVLMMQKEIVDRICAASGNKSYGRLSVMIQACCIPEKMFDIGPGAFSPAPQVDSSVVRLIPDQTRLAIHNTRNFNEIVKQAFSQRRKTIRNSLGHFFTAEELTTLGLDDSARAENLSVSDYICLSNHTSR